MGPQAQAPTPATDEHAVLPEFGVFELRLDRDQSESVSFPLVTIPSTGCALGGVRFDWSVRQPYAEGTGPSVEFFDEYQGAHLSLGAGSSGESEAGFCDPVSVSNRSDTSILVEVRYVAVMPGPAEPVGAPSAAQSPTGTAPPSACTVFERGTAVSVTFMASDALQACQSWIQARGQQGEFWSTDGEPTEQQSMVCIFRYESGAHVQVDDGGGQFNGRTICAGFAGTPGWVEDLPAEQASATAAANQRRIDAALRTLTSDLSDLQAESRDLSDVSIAADLTTMRDAIKGVYQDLQTTLTADTTLVCGDAGVVEGDVGALEGDQGVLESDVSALNTRIESVQHLLSIVPADMRELTSAEASLPSYQPAGVPEDAPIQQAVQDGIHAVSGAESAITNVRAQAAALVQQAQAYSSQADAACKQATP